MQVANNGLKIAYLFSRYPVPSQTFCDTEIRALEEAGHEIEIYSCSPPTTSFRHGVDDWPRAWVAYAPPPDGLAWWEAAARRDGRWPAATIACHEAQYGRRYEPAKRARHALYFADLLRRQGVEHLHVHFANRATHAALFIHELTGVPFSFTAHAQDFLVDLGSDALLGEMCEKTAFVVAVSEWSRRALVEKCPSAEAKIHRVYNGLPLDRWPEPTRQVLTDPTLRIFSVGRLIDFKGFADLIAACQILKERGIPFQCDIAGDGPLRTALLEQAKTFTQPRARIRMLGLLPQERIREHFDGCQVFALACRVDEKGACDVLPTVILEAMAAGRAVVSTRLAGVPEMVDDGRTGLLVPPGQPEALADALIRLGSDPELRGNFGFAGRAKLVAEFSAKASAQQLGVLMTVARTGSALTPSSRTDFSSWCLLEQWPVEGLNRDSFHRLPAVRGLALTATLATSGLECLPDALVLETWWRAHAEIAYRIESWRGELGNGVSTEDFLLAARRALYLAASLKHEPISSRRIHAVGAGAVLCTWLLVRLGAVETASLFLGRAPGLRGATLRRLAPLFAGGWIVGEKKLAASLGPVFSSDEPSADVWLQGL